MDGVRYSRTAALSCHSTMADGFFQTAVRRWDALRFAGIRELRSFKEKAGSAGGADSAGGWLQFDKGCCLVGGIHVKKVTFRD